LTFAESCSATVILVTAPELRMFCCAVGPFLFPAKPAIPAPEFCSLGAVTCGIAVLDLFMLGTVTRGPVISADAVRVDIVNATAAALPIHFIMSYLHCGFPFSVNIYGERLRRGARSDLS
jgi:hypothetical protein